MKKFLLPLIVASQLVACVATPYKAAKDGIPDGYHSEESPGGKLTKVFFYGNPYTKPSVTQEYALRFAAELAQQKQKPYFAVYESLSAAALNVKMNKPEIAKGYLGNSTAYFYVDFHSEKEAGDFSYREILDQYQDKIEG